MREINSMPPLQTKPVNTHLLGEEEAARARSAEAQRFPQRVVSHLSKIGKPIYAILDSARDPRILPLLRLSDCEFKILYSGNMAESMSEYAPYLVSLPPGTPLLKKLLDEGWGQSWGYFFACNDDFSAIRRHFRRLLAVRMPNGKQVLFRFYDPRVLRAFLPTAISDEIDQFFGNISALYLEAENPKVLLTYTRSGAMQNTELIQDSTPLSEEQSR